VRKKLSGRGKREMATLQRAEEVDPTTMSKCDEQMVLMNVNRDKEERAALPIA
jgi:hypothetical protein